ncbi:tubulin binding cofactor C-domain-containing protein [Amylocystis lapponica]|nr:tubulin binding cofactor C-domain-containing protein [Amylocystis lapponica]
MADTNQSLAQEFYIHFQATRSELTTRLDALKSDRTAHEASEQLSLDIAKLRKELTDVTSYLPSYDQRQCELRLKELEESLHGLRLASAPKPKFAFKRKANKPSPSASPAQERPPSASIPAPAVPNDTQLSSGLSLSGQSHRFLTLASLSAPRSSPTSDITISDLDHCVVNLLPPPSSHDPDGTHTIRFTALHARNLAHCVLIMPRIDGSALLHDMSRCTVVLGCHQYRMHTSSHVDVYLAIPSNPIIEHCTGIRFAGYPATLLSADAGVDSDSTPASSHLSVQDFSHIRATPSPNWSALSEERTLEDVDWQHASGIQDSDVDNSLQELLPRAEQ